MMTTLGAACEKFYKELFFARVSVNICSGAKILVRGLRSFVRGFREYVRGLKTSLSDMSNSCLEQILSHEHVHRALTTSVLLFKMKRRFSMLVYI